jgi:imidazolonepropionase-like amidohydrolase
MLVSTITGEPWTKHVKAMEDAKKKIAEADKKLAGRALTTGEKRQRETDLGTDLETRRANAQKLIRAGCIVTPGTDSYWAAAPELAREPKPENQDHGMGTILAIEGLVELGMTPAQAIVAGTKNGAMACKRATDFGTVEAGKLADLVLLDGDPMADIHNLRKVRAVWKEGRPVELEKLPLQKVLSK